MFTQDDLRNPSEVQSKSALLQMITGFWTSQAIYVAAKLGIADLLKDGAKSSDLLAKSTETSPRELYRLLRFLTSSMLVIFKFYRIVNHIFAIIPIR